MKPIRLLALLLCVAFFWSGVRKGSAVSRLKTEHEVLVNQARSIGLPENGNDDERRTSRASGRSSSTDIPAERLKDELVATYHRFKALEGSEDTESQLKVEAEAHEWMGRFIDLSPNDLKRMITDLTSDSSLDPKMVRELVTVALAVAVSLQGETAAELALAHREKGGHIPGVVGNWAQQDPSNAFAWLEKNRELLGKDYSFALRQAVTQSAARDPALCLAGLSKIEDSKERALAKSGLAFCLRDDENREAFLVELRTATLGDADRNDVLKELGGSLPKKSVEAPGAWMNGLSPEEATSVANGIAQSPHASPRPDAWLDWMGKSLPPEKVADTAKPLIKKWINEDYQAAGEWINRQPAGSFRNEAAANYARMMAKRFPDTAKDWANSLPEGPDKRKLLGELE